MEASAAGQNSVLHLMNELLKVTEDQVCATVDGQIQKKEVIESALPPGGCLQQTTSPSKS